MKPANNRAPQKRDWSALAQQALRNRDLVGARAALTEALRMEPRNAKLHYELANVLQALGDIEDSARHLTLTLRHNLQHSDAARSLSRLLARFVVSEPARLDPFGLKAALAFDTVDPQPLVDNALRCLAATEADLADALNSVRLGDPLAAARKLILHRTSGALKLDLLITSLHAGVVSDPEIEQLFTAVRRVLLLEAEAQRFEDRALYAFALALLVQGWNNDHAWAETEDERQALDRLAIDSSRLLAGDLEAARRFLLFCLYRSPEALLGPCEAGDCRALRPKSFRDLLTAQFEGTAEERRAAASLQRLGPLIDDTSRRVASQYEQSPYPRWKSVQVSPPGRIRAGLARYFTPERLAFMDRPFDVLIAGAGTGQQALQSAFAYGPEARLLATDLSAASLAYGQRAASRYGVRNIEFMIADILDLDRLDRSFDIIECVGVLHHMADPWAGWRKLLGRLKPGGLMYIGLYSATSRANIAKLRAAPEHPGPGCSDEAARAYRAKLLSRSEGQLGAELRTSRNFYALKEFRDLILHESEQHMSLPDIARFLDESGLVFRGFMMEQLILDDFASRHPDSAWPGKLDDWALYERDNPRSFDAMYCFWCERA